jgi:peroxiredoxin Q/BCP
VIQRASVFALRLCLVVALAATLAAGALCSCTVQRPDGGSGLIAEGGVVPDLRAKDHLGKSVDLRAMAQGRLLLVFFYPKDNTPGCTKEACTLRDAWTRYAAAGIDVVGVSKDSAEDHRAFSREHRLPFSLVADEDGTWATAFGVRSIAGMHARVSFLIGKDGRILHVYEDVDPARHAEEVLSDARSVR